MCNLLALGAGYFLQIWFLLSTCSPRRLENSLHRCREHLHHCHVFQHHRHSGWGNHSQWRGAHLWPLNIQFWWLHSVIVPQKLIWHCLVMDHSLRILAQPRRARRRFHSANCARGRDWLLPSICRWLLRGHEVQSAPKIALLTLGCNDRHNEWTLQRFGVSKLCHFTAATQRELSAQIIFSCFWCGTRAFFVILLSIW